MICNSMILGLLPEEFFPSKTGKNYKPKKILQEINHLRANTTIIRGLENKNVTRGHSAAPCLLSSFQSFSSPKNKISVDQRAADALGQKTRFSSLSLRTSETKQLQNISWDRHRIPTPQLQKQEDIFDLLFGINTNSKNQLQIIAEERSILDNLLSQVKSLKMKNSKRDSEKIDEYLTSVRDLEQRLDRKKYWAKTPKAKVKRPYFPAKRTLMDILDLNFEMMHMALATDTTRFIAQTINYNGAIGIDEVRSGYHVLSHHGKSPEKLKKLLAIECAIMKKYGAFIDKLKNHKTPSGNLLNETILFLGSPLGSGSSHANKDLPVLLAGGNFKHGSYIKYNQTKPLANLHLTMLQQLGIEDDKFSDSNGTLELI